MEIIEKTKKDLPNATIILVLGILSLVFCWCYGFIGFILGIIAVVLAGPQRKAIGVAIWGAETAFEGLNNFK